MRLAKVTRKILVQFTFLKGLDKILRKKSWQILFKREFR